MALFLCAKWWMVFRRFPPFSRGKDTTILMKRNDREQKKKFETQENRLVLGYCNIGPRTDSVWSGQFWHWVWKSLPDIPISFHNTTFSSFLLPMAMAADTTARTADSSRRFLAWWDLTGQNGADNQQWQCSVCHCRCQNIPWLSGHKDEYPDREGRRKPQSWFH